MELNNPTERIAHMAIEPLELMVIKTKQVAASALNTSTLPG